MYCLNHNKANEHKQHFTVPTNTKKCNQCIVLFESQQIRTWFLFYRFGVQHDGGHFFGFHQFRQTRSFQSFRLNKTKKTFQQTNNNALTTSSKNTTFQSTIRPCYTRCISCYTRKINIQNYTTPNSNSNSKTKQHHQSPTQTQTNYSISISQSLNITNQTSKQSKQSNINTNNT